MHNTSWTKEEQQELSRLNTPLKIQEFINSCAYNSTEETRSPRYIMMMRRAHCMEGGLFAAACLEILGFPPLILDLRAENDDDHIIALYRVGKYWGAIAKSNFTTLKFREPVYRTLRELALSYFDFYFNTDGDKSLRSYSVPFDLNRFNHIGWRTTEADLEVIGDRLNTIRHYPLLTPDQKAALSPADPLLLKSSMLGSDPAGLFVPGSKK